MIPECRVVSPSSENPTAPAATNASKSTGRSPRRSSLIAAIGWTRTSASRSVRRDSSSSAATESSAGIGIRHAEQCRKPASSRRGSPGSNRLLPFLTRLAQMDVDIDQPGRHNQPGHVDNSLGGFGIERTDCSNHTLVNANIRDAIQATGWVDDPPSTEKQPAAHRHGRTEKNRLAVQLGPGDGASAEHLVMVCVTNSLVTGVTWSIGVSDWRRQKTVVARPLSKCGQMVQCAD